MLTGAATSSENKTSESLCLCVSVANGFRRVADVLIVGAGPAGAIAALVLARSGARVTLLERATFPRDKLCGDTINPGALSILQKLGLEQVTADGLPVDGMVVTGERGVRVTGRYGSGTQGIAIARRVLDARLAVAAAEAGVRFAQGVLVRQPLMDRDRRVIGVEAITASGRAERYTAPVTIAADGRYSRVARALELTRTPASPRRWAVGATFRGVTGLSSLGEMHVRGDRYIGVAPLPGGDANGCVVTADRSILRTRNLLFETMRSDRETASRFARARMVAQPSVLGPLALEASTAGMPGLLLAGDAAGFIDPMTGDGLRFAFRGGELAAQQALRVLADGWEDAHLRLEHARRLEFAAKWRFNRTLRRLAASPAAVRAAEYGAVLSPALLRRVICYAGDVGIA